MSIRDKKFASGIYLFAAIVIILAGVKVAQPLIVPFLLAIFITILCAPLLLQLQHKRVPVSLAVLTIIILMGLISTAFVLLFGSVFDDFWQDLPSYQEKLQDRFQVIVQFLATYDVHVNQQSVMQYLNPASVMKLVSELMVALSGTLANIFLIFLTVILILFEIAQFPQKLQLASSHPTQTAKRWQHILKHVNHYIFIKTLLSLLTGVLVAVWLYLIDIDHAVLWGLLAFLLNYIPNIGSILAAVPAILLGFLEKDMTGVSLVILGYLVINSIIGNVIEPKLMGRTLGLSTLVVFLSLIFWGWLLGPVGMLLSAPMTMVLKIILDSSEQTRWLAIWLGSDTQNITFEEMKKS